MQKEHKYRRIVLLAFAALLPALSPCQEGNPVRYDSLRTNYSTIDIIDDSTRQQTNLFYDSLRLRFSRSKLTLALYDLLVRRNNELPLQKRLGNRSEIYFNSYRGKIIRSVKVNKIDVFGPSVWDPSRQPSTRLETWLNKSHFTTRDRIIRDNLLFSPGDPIQPYQLADNERLLRSLPFIKDARIIMSHPSGDSVDLEIIIQDILSTGFGLAVDDINKSRYEVYSKNILGLGHQMSVMLHYDGDYLKKTGWETNYEISNFLGSFININLHYYNAFNRENAGFILYRKFYSLDTKIAGGMDIHFTETLVKPDTSTLFYPYRYNYQDVWLGRSVLLNAGSRTRLVVAARFIKNNVFERPYFVSEHAYYKYHNRYITLLGLTYSRENFYLGNLIYQYGRMEDIPYGILVSLTTGLETSEFSYRGYAAAKISAGNYKSSRGYLAGSLAFGGFIKDKAFEQGILQCRSNYYSNLFTAGRYFVRQFVDLDYTLGIHRFTDEYVSIADEYGIRGLVSDSLDGTQRLVLNLETVAFAPRYVAGFRFAFFGFADFGLIGNPGLRIANDRFYSGFGVGVRIRNENLVFRTFQIRFGFYPNMPANTRWNPLYVSFGKSYEKISLDPSAPDIITFR